MATLPAGTWPSPITARSLVGGSVGISEVVPDGDDVWWAESRPDNGGRTTLVRWRDGVPSDVTAPDTNVRTRSTSTGEGRGGPRTAWRTTSSSTTNVCDGSSRAASRCC